MVIGFLIAVWLMRRLSRDLSSNPEHISNVALYALVAGVIGARIFYVIHYFDQFKGNLLSIFAIHRGGLELLGGVILAMTVVLFYLHRHKLPIRRYLDILAIGLILGLAFGRIGCFFNGCCYGKPSSVVCAVRFPYNSPAYQSQTSPDPQRNRPEAQLKLPDKFFKFTEESNGQWYRQLKSWDKLTAEQKMLARTGPYQALTVHPTQLYSALNAAFLCFILYLFRKKYQRFDNKNPGHFFAKPGCVFALMFIFYGITRFFLEYLRDDNPFEFDGLTVSQNISIAMLILGTILMAVFAKIKPKPLSRNPAG